LTSEINKHISGRGGNLKIANKQLQTVRDKIHTTEGQFLMQPHLSQASYAKVMTSLRAEEAKIQRQIAEFNANNQVYWDRLKGFMLLAHDVRNAFYTMALLAQQRFVNMVFDSSLSYFDNSYRTPYLHPLFSHNELILKEKRLLVIEQPLIKLRQSPVSRESGNVIESFMEIADVLNVEI
jgi:hypothetical protein